MDWRLALDALVTGLPYALNFVGVWLVYRLLKDFDLTVDGSFTLGAAVAAVLATGHGWHPISATLVAGAAGAIAGLVTAAIHLRMKITLLLSGIITMIALWSVNLRVMGLPNLSFFRQDTIFTPFLGVTGLGNDLRVLAIVAAILLFGAVGLGYFLKTELGLSMRATGSNQTMAKSVGISTGFSVLLFLTISNFLVGFSGAITAQQQAFADINMGIGVILVAITAILLGELVVRSSGNVWMGILAVVVGTVLYHLAVAIAVRLGLRPSDLRGFTAFLLLAAIGTSMMLSRGERWYRIRRRDAPDVQPLIAADAASNDSENHGSVAQEEESALTVTQHRASSDSVDNGHPQDASITIGRRGKSAVQHSALSLRGLSVVYNHGLPNEVVALRELDLNIRPGEFVTVIGSNGAGKSTLVGTIAGAVTPTTGEIFLGTRRLTHMSQHVRAKYVARVFQDPLGGTCPDLSIEENLALAQNRVRGHRSLSLAVTKEKRTLFRKYLAQFGLGLEDRLSEYVERLSGGQRQALALLMAVMEVPEILLLDEHTAALDPKNQTLLQGMTNDLVGESGCTTIMVTHNMEQAIRYGDRMLMLHRGAVLFDVEGDQKRRLTVERLVSAFHNAGDTVFTDEMLFG